MQSGYPEIDNFGSVRVKQTYEITPCQQWQWLVVQTENQIATGWTDRCHFVEVLRSRVRLPPNENVKRSRHLGKPDNQVSRFGWNIIKEADGIIRPNAPRNSLGTCITQIAVLKRLNRKR